MELNLTPYRYPYEPTKTTIHEKKYFRFVVLKLAGLRHLFDVIVGNEDYTRHKPSPDAFLTACEKLQVDPAKCWGFEDT